MCSIKYNPGVNPRDFEINHLLPWLVCAQIFHSESPYSCPYNLDADRYLSEYK